VDRVFTGFRSAGGTPALRIGADLVRACGKKGDVEMEQIKRFKKIK